MNPALPPGTDHCVMIAAPHTSNWDAIFLIASFDMMKIPMKFTLKKEWVRWPFKSMMLSVGAIGIDRSPKKPGEARPNMTDVLADIITSRDSIALVVTPEGTRSLRTTWKTGFYYVAMKAKVPIALGYMDYAKKVTGVGKMIYPSGDMKKDLKEIMEFYKDISPKHAEKYSVDIDYLEGRGREERQ